MNARTQHAQADEPPVSGADRVQADQADRPRSCVQPAVSTRRRHQRAQGELYLSAVCYAN